MSQEGIKIVKLDNVYNLNTDTSNYNNKSNNSKPKKPRKSKYVNKKKISCELLLTNTEKIKKLLEKKKKTLKSNTCINEYQKSNNQEYQPIKQNQISDNYEYIKPESNSDNILENDIKPNQNNVATETVNVTKIPSLFYPKNNKESESQSIKKLTPKKLRAVRTSNKRSRSPKKLKSKRKVRKLAPQTIDRYFKEIVNDSGADISKLKPIPRGRKSPKNKKTKKRIEMENIINILKQVLARNDYELIEKFVSKIKRHHAVNLLVLFKISKLGTNAPTPLLKNILKIYLAGGFTIKKY